MVEKEGALPPMVKLPTPLSSKTAFFTHLGVGAKEQAFLEKYASFRYDFVEIPKRGGGKRPLLVPEKRLKFLQQKILALLSEIYSPRSPVHGFTKDRNVISNANAHQARPFLLNIDISNFFGSISWKRVHGMLVAIGLDDDLARSICALCVTNNQLPQGAPTSPILSNMVCFRLDRELMQFAGAHKFRYTRYADDISLSSYVPPLALFNDGLPPDGQTTLENISNPLRIIFASNGFSINTNKIRFSGKKFRKEVTGLKVNEFTNVKRNFIRDLRASIYKIEKIGLAAAQADYATRYSTKASLGNVLRGRLEWIAQVRGRSFAPYRTLGTRFNKLFPKISVPIDPTYQEVINRSVWIVEYCYDNPKGEVVIAQGTAFFLRGVGLVSADHTFDDLSTGLYADIYRPENPSDTYQAAPSSKRCSTRDLVILNHNIPLHAHLDLSPTTMVDNIKQPITALGFPSFGPGDGISEIPGHIISRPTKSSIKLVEVSSILNDGLSGGPIINDRYQVVAVVQRGGTSETKQYGVDIREIDHL